MSWNPAIGLPEAIAIAAVFLGTAWWLAWHGAREAPVRAQRWLFALRSFGLLALALLWLNPGYWLDETASARRDWLVLLDRSASMKTGLDEHGTRWETAVRLAEKLRTASGAQGEVKVRPFAVELEDNAPATAALVPDGAGTDLARALTGALDQRSAPLAGLIVLSDGRLTSRVKLDEIALRARGRGLPIHAIPLGGAWGSRDLILTALPHRITAFRGQPVKISAQLENRGLGAIKPTVILSGADGKELARQDAQLEDGARASVVFDLASVPENGGDYTIHTAPWPGEQVPANNADTVRVKVLTSKTRVLLLEGAPYWDSKFLAQLLRQQSAVEILTVHRLNEDHYFRVLPGSGQSAEPLASPESVFPDSAEALARYDLIVFGKGADGFLTPARTAALIGFVRDQGGAVMFARGKPYSGRFAPLEVLEPVEWGAEISGGFHFVPLADQGAGLFGAALPAAGDHVWPTLPLLEDAHQVARLKPFAHVLAEGQPDEKQTRVPLLITRRFGRGMIATVNADGLWRWDFRPEVREQGAVYQQFWVQLMQWCATFSEFLPGQNYAVRLAEASAETGQPVRAIITYRGAASPQLAPFLKITRDGQAAGQSEATALPGGGEREWAAVLTPDQPGQYQVRVADHSRSDKPEGEASLAVAGPPAEADDLRPDSESLQTLARGSGGEVFPPAEVERLASMLWKSDTAAAHAKPRWEPLWPRWWVAVLIAAAFGTEWWMRRREGLL